MKLTIDRVVIRDINLPLRIPFQISGGVMRSRRSIIVELHAGGAVGYGESAPFEFPFYSSETIGSVLALYRDLLIGRVQGKSFDSIEAFEAALTAGVRGNPFARCGFENAFWDLLAVTRGMTLQRLIAEKLGEMGVVAEHLAYAPRIASGVAIGIPESGEISELRDWIAEYRDEGYQRVKIKIKPGWDEVPCAAAREILGPDFLLWPDANASYDLARHESALKLLDAFKMAFIEQPLHHDDLMDHAELGRRIATPVCLDESLKGEMAARQTLELPRGARIWNIKVQRMGGLMESLRVYKRAAEAGVKLWGGTMPESGIGAQPITALASFPLFVYPADIEPSARWYHEGTDPVPITMDGGGWIEVPQVRGAGKLIDWQLYDATAREILF